MSWVWKGCLAKPGKLVASKKLEAGAWFLQSMTQTSYSVRMRKERSVESQHNCAAATPGFDPDCQQK
jgi:hypothetical protein